MPFIKSLNLLVSFFTPERVASLLLGRPFYQEFKSETPSESARKFLEFFESTFGTVHPEFYQGSYSQVRSRSRALSQKQALELAKRETRWMIALLYASEHDHTDAFYRYVLSKVFETTEPLSDPIVSFPFWQKKMRSCGREIYKQ